MVKAPIFQGAIKLRNVLDCQAKILEAVMDRRQCGGFVDIIFIVFRLFHCYPVVLLGSSHLLCLACQSGLQWVVRRKGK
jgi:hypothetical protein